MLSATCAGSKRVCVTEQQQETPMWMVDANTFRITMANHSAEKMFGYTAQELSSKTIFDLVIPEQVDRLREAFGGRGFAGHGGTWTLQLPDGHQYRIKIRYHYVVRDGSKLQFTFAEEIHGHPHFPEGKTKGVRGM
jgi:PAS domain S-box-containing protein